MNALAVRVSLLKHALVKIGINLSLSLYLLIV